MRESLDVTPWTEARCAVGHACNGRDQTVLTSPLLVLVWWISRLLSLQSTATGIKPTRGNDLSPSRDTRASGRSADNGPLGVTKLKLLHGHDIFTPVSKPELSIQRILLLMPNAQILRYANPQHFSLPDLGALLLEPAELFDLRFIEEGFRLHWRSLGKNRSQRKGRFRSSGKR